MRSIYMDEAGISNAREDIWRIVASIIVDADREFELLQDRMRQVITSHVPPSLQNGFSFHATDVYSGSKSIDRKSWPLEQRLTFFEAFLRILIENHIPISVAYVKRDSFVDDVNLEAIRRNWTAESPLTEKQMAKLDFLQFEHMLAMSLCAEKSDLFLRRYLKGSERGMIIAENHDLKAVLKSAAVMHRDSPLTIPGVQGNPTLEIKYIVDKPQFADKGDAPLLQLADAVAFVFRRALNKQKDGRRLLEILMGVGGAAHFLSPAPWQEIGFGCQLFNTQKYWDEDQKNEVRARLIAAWAKGG